ncbi:hypothetical protein [Vibrio scophthalmi]|uniref:Uncharacterized protein n=1 Tax=Vibrio scophthalmi LMG 19158 TaxID=870967 RepID=F9RM97_9VIBR|nr:hypothetical protein [Vibrio scophthalmi]EGU38516.1 hypothetical protein VIS19158_07510 [Vibrio scophthalmi LMG 19158]
MNKWTNIWILALLWTTNAHANSCKIEGYMSLIANNMETKMNKYFLAEVCSYLLHSTLKNQDTEICLSKTAEYEGENYIF